MHDEWRAQVPLMASAKVGTPGFVNGTWTQDGHAIQVFDNEDDARRYHAKMRDEGYLERPGLKCLVWGVAEVGAESQAGQGHGDPTDHRHRPRRGRCALRPQPRRRHLG